jgi:glycosyltransferase involved in cell wall biosynthesis
MILLSHPTGNEFVRETLSAFEREGLLGEFWTTLSWNPDAPINRYLPRRLREQLHRRSFQDPIRRRTHTVPLREIARMVGGAVGFSGRHETGALSVDTVLRQFDRRVAQRLERIDKCDAVYAYEDAALQSFQVARNREFHRVYDLPIAYWQTSQRLLREESERYPDWEPTLGATRDSERKLERKTEELELAQLVICPSTFVLDSLPSNARAQKRCIVAPFGTPDVDLQTTDRKPNDRLRLLFAGALGQRKGLADLFAAMKLVGPKGANLVLMGSRLQSLDWYRERFRDFIYESPRPHGEVLKLMQSCDVLILPSIVEGRALVQQEAMACGLPVIATRNAGADDVILDGETGFLVPIRSPKALAEKIQWCLANRSLLRGMGIAARQRARKLTWRAYGETIVAAVRELIRQ